MLEITSILKPKSKEDVLKQISLMNILSNEVYRNYLNKYNEEIPDEYLPLYNKIVTLLKKQYPHYTTNPGNLRIRRTQMHFFVPSFADNRQIKLVMYPTRRIPELEHLRSGTDFRISSYDQVVTIIKFLETH